VLSSKSRALISRIGMSLPGPWSRPGSGVGNLQATFSKGHKPPSPGGLETCRLPQAYGLISCKLGQNMGYFALYYTEKSTYPCKFASLNDDVIDDDCNHCSGTVSSKTLESA
jgi:hypothetical protein